MHAHKKTKIISTVGPASESPEMIKKLIKAGVNVFRFNMKHNEVKWHEEAIARVQKVADQLNIPIGILIDLQGPEIRIKTRYEADIEVKRGQEVTFSTAERAEEVDFVVQHDTVINALGPDDRFSIDDGFVQLKVVSKKGGLIRAKVADKTVIKNNKGLNLFGKDIGLPSLIDDDLERLHVATIKRVDFVALSFVRSAHDIETLRKEMKQRKIQAQVVAKVESQAGLDNIAEIIDASDVVMVARGDLGVETPIEKLAYHQKQIINKCRQKRKAVIVATQMLDSMIRNPIPTRAEITDVANAVLDGTDAVMLSGETATGKYPLKAVEAMTKIAQFNEAHTNVISFDVEPENATELIVDAAEFIAEHGDSYSLDYIIVFTETGYTAKVLSSLRPKIPMIAVTAHQKTVEELSLSYGVRAEKIQFPMGKILSPDFAVEQLKGRKLVKKGDRLLIVHGQHWQIKGQTNAVLIQNVE